MEPNQYALKPLSRSGSTTERSKTKSRFGRKKKQRYGYNDRSPLRNKNLSKSLQVNRAFKHRTQGKETHKLIL